jgi:transposase
MGLIAKNVFQVHGIDENGEVAFNSSERRATSSGILERPASVWSALRSWQRSHHWARGTDQLSHNVKLIPPAYAKPFYVKRGKSGCR